MLQTNTSEPVLLLLPCTRGYPQIVKGVFITIIEKLFACLEEKLNFSYTYKRTLFIQTPYSQVFVKYRRKHTWSDESCFFLFTVWTLSVASEIIKIDRLHRMLILNRNGPIS